MGAAADRLAVGVEEHELDAASPWRASTSASEAQALDLEGGGELADVAAGIRVAELHGEPADAR